MNKKIFFRFTLRLRVLVPIFGGFALTILTFWLLSPAVQVQADTDPLLGTDPVGLAWGEVSVSDSDSVVFASTPSPGPSFFAPLSTLAGDPAFAIGNPFGMLGDDTRSVAVGDMDGDGDLDIVSGNYNEQNAVCLNDGVGNFPTSNPFGTGEDRTYSVAVGDVDGDGDLDIVTGNYGEQNMVYLNDGVGNFANGVPFGTGGDDTRSVAVGDLNGDGYLDIVTGNYGDPVGEPNVVYLNDGGGNFANGVPFGTGEDRTQSVAVGNVDGDGDLDIITGNYDEQNVVYLNDGWGNFTSSINYGTGGENTYSVAVGDMDGDGYLDIVVGNYGMNYMYRNDGAGNFTDSVPYGDGDNIMGVAVGDVDVDGDLDIVTGNSWGQNSVYLNDGGGTFPTTSVDFGTETEETWCVVVGDVDGDGDLDIVTGNRKQQNMVYLNNGGGNFATSNPFGTGGDGTYSVAVGDVDGDGDLDIVTGNYDEQNTVCLNDGGGNFPTSNPFGTGEDATYSVAVGDVDGDGNLDIVTGNYQEQNVVYLNDGAGNFATNGVPFGTGDDITYSVALGDVDGDGNLDIVSGNSGEQNAVYLNDGGGNFPTNGVPFGTGDDITYSVALGDMNGDGNLDIVTGNSGEQNIVYLNDGGGDFASKGVPFGTGEDQTYSLALGDMNGDSILDVITGNMGESNIVYFYDGGKNFANGVSFGPGGDITTSVAVGDVDGDGDLDIVTGNFFSQSMLYLNDGGENFANGVPFGPELYTCWRVAVGDVDGDGDLDIVTENFAQNVVYLNTLHEPTPFLQNPPQAKIIRPGWVPVANFFHTPQILTEDIIPIKYILLDPEADPFARVQAFYSLNGGDNWQEAVPTGTITTNLSAGYDYKDSISDDIDFNWIEISGSGTPISLGDDTYAGPFPLGFTFRLYTKSFDQFWVHSNGGLTFTDPGAALYYGNSCLPAGYAPDYLVAPFWDDLNPSAGGQAYYQQIGRDTIVIEYQQIPHFGSGGPYTFEVIIKGDGNITFQYLDMQNLLDSATIGIQVTGLAYQVACDTTYVQDSLAGFFQGGNYTYLWDTFASGFFGQSDNVVFRLEAYPTKNTPPNSTPIYMYPFASSTTFPFRVRGTQIHVVDNALDPVEGAVVFRLESNQTEGGQPYTYGAGQLLHTDQDGFLQGYGELYPGDRIAALLKITNTDSYTLYHTSASPTEAGLEMFEVSGFGVQELIIRENNPLVLFNLDISLEWDARDSQGEPTSYLDDLEFDIEYASKLLYDWSNGQAALGRVRVYQNREHWNDSHIQVYASNRLRPNANQGGVITDVYTETIGTEEITYEPGQVRMGAVWNRFGGATVLAEDWPRTLVHELGHYLFFLDDNYLGLSEDGLLLQVESCPGAMTDPYSDDDALGFDEFHPETDWLPNCEETLSQQATGRSDWETIKTFYPLLNYVDPGNTGPNVLPLAVTQIEIIEPDESETPLDVPIFYLKKPDDSPYLSSNRTRAFLLQGERLVDLGRPIDDWVIARGARVDETLCAFDLPAHLGGCETLSLTGKQLHLAHLPDWEPEVVVTPVTSRTFQIEVAHIAPSQRIYARLYPNSANAPSEVKLTEMPNGTYTDIIETVDPVMFGYVHIRVEGSNPSQEIITDFSIGGNPGPRRAGPGSLGPRRAGPGSLAPVVSGDGQAIIYGDAAFEEGEFYAMQTATYLQLPEYAHAVGQAYYLITSPQAPDLSQTSISISYLEIEVPRTILEEWLIIYYYDGTKWIALETTVDMMMNYASARTQGPGLYVLAYGEGSYETFLPLTIYK